MVVGTPGALWGLTSVYRTAVSGVARTWPRYGHSQTLDDCLVLLPRRTPSYSTTLERVALVSGHVHTACRFFWLWGKGAPRGVRGVRTVPGDGRSLGTPGTPEDLWGATGKYGPKDRSGQLNQMRFRMTEALAAALSHFHRRGWLPNIMFLECVTMQVSFLM